MSDDAPRTSNDFRGTQIRDEGGVPLLVTHRHRLMVVAGPDKGLEREVNAPRVTIGASRSNDIVLTDQTVSRHHCEILVRDEKYVLRDLGSTNGTHIDGTPILEAFLVPGARVQLGDTEIVFDPKKKWVRVEDDGSDHFGALYGASAPMRAVFALLSKVGPTDLSCILVGETGTGKELAARALHDASPRAGRPFVVVDCGAISENLIEAELFGHERGAFTGADKQRVGAFELAEGGTVFLDEIGELPIELQPKLLRVLERREVKRLGAAKHVEVDVRVVAATHRDLTSMVTGGKFREDLYYRLAEVVVDLPPLRARREDIPLLVTRILADLGAGKVRGIDAPALSELSSRPWAGNVRELRNVIRRAVALAPGELLSVEDLGSVAAQRPAPRAAAMPASPQSAANVGSAVIGEDLPIKEARDRWVASMEREYLARVLERSGGDLDRAAQEAGLHRKSLERLIRQHGLRDPDKAGD